LLGLIDFFLLREAERRLIHLSPAKRVYLRTELQGAIALMQAADRMPRHAERTALAIQALLRLTSAVYCSRSQDTQASVEMMETTTALEFLISLPQCHDHHEAIAHMRGMDLTRPYALIKHTQLQQLFGTLERLLDTRTPRDFALARLTRGSLLVLALVVAVWSLTSPRNLARGKEVYASSIHHDTPAERYGQPRLSRVVDGLRTEKPFALATELQVKPWVTVDLDRNYRLSSVVICGRGRGDWVYNFSNDELPVTLSVSTDNKLFRPVALRTLPIEWSVPWRVELHGAAARYVRLSSYAPGAKRIVINEFEIYGR
jgi:hypothetical protein